MSLVHPAAPQTSEAHSGNAAANAPRAVGSAHTPGPWFMFPHAYRDEGPGAFSIGTNSNRDLADILCSRFQWPERASEMEANGRLIAAAPELLEALREVAQSLAWLSFGECRGFSDGLLTSNQALARARAAITKATGEQQ